jgi:hypothetical protein
MAMFDPAFSQDRRGLLVSGIALAMDLGVLIAFPAPVTGASAGQVEKVMNAAGAATDLGWMPDCVC